MQDVFIVGPISYGFDHLFIDNVHGLQNRDGAIEAAWIMN